MRAYLCFTKQTRWTSHFFFFGSKYKETHVVDSQPPSPLSCKSWSSIENTRDGKLIELTDSKTSFGTNNKVKIDYSWPTSTSGFVQNNYLNKGVIFYDFFKDSIIPLTNCHISTGYCATYTMKIVWDVSRFSTCLKTRRLGLQSLKLYYNHTSLYRVEIPSRACLFIVGHFVHTRRCIVFPKSYFALSMAFISFLLSVRIYKVFTKRKLSFV